MQGDGPSHFLAHASLLPLNAEPCSTLYHVPTAPQAAATLATVPAPPPPPSPTAVAPQRRRSARTHPWQVGEPHVCALPLAGNTSMAAPSLIVRHDGFFRRDKLWRGAGVALPVFSLRTRVRAGGRRGGVGGVVLAWLCTW